MSVQRNIYLLRGTVQPYGLHKDRHDVLEQYMDSAFKGIHHHDGLCVLFDGMHGKYVAFGRVLAKSANMQGFEPELVQVPPFDLDNSKEFQEKLSALVGTFCTVNDYLITHYR